MRTVHPVKPAIFNTEKLYTTLSPDNFDDSLRFMVVDRPLKVFLGQLARALFQVVSRGVYRDSNGDLVYPDEYVTPVEEWAVAVHQMVTGSAEEINKRGREKVADGMIHVLMIAYANTDFQIMLPANYNEDTFNTAVAEIRGRLGV